jgi:hypothetical protein
MPERLHFLFVCHANMDRSPTAEAVCARIAKENSLDIEASSACLSRGADRPVTKEMAGRAEGANGAAVFDCQGGKPESAVGCSQIVAVPTHRSDYNGFPRVPTETSEGKSAE